MYKHQKICCHTCKIQHFLFRMLLSRGPLVSSGPVVLRSSGLLVPWSSGPPVLWSCGILWSLGALGFAIRL